MTAIEDARAALAEWVEHLTDAPSQSRSDRMAAALRALIAEHERLTAEMHQRELHHFETEKMLVEAGIDPDAAPPTDDEFDALEDLITEARDEYPRDVRDMPSSELTERILAAGFRRQGSPADEWEYATAIRDRVDGGLYDIWPTEQPMSAEQIAEWVAQDREGWVNYPPERTVVNVRRRKAVEAGPWEPVEAARGVPC